MREDYLKAKRLGERALFKGAAAGRNAYLPALDMIIKGRQIAGEESLGIMEIPLFMVAGTRTVGRQNAFAENYMPLLDADSEFGHKWAGLYDTQIEEGFREPVKVYEYLRRFYVLEGNKRVSILKYLDNPVVTADVIRLIPAWSEDPEIMHYYEFLHFFRSVPLYDISIRQPGGYFRLAKAFGIDLSSPAPEEDVLHLKRNAAYFRKIFQEHGGSHTDILSGDALLAYLDVYPDTDICGLPGKDLIQRLDRIRGELLVAANEDNVALIYDPEKPAGHVFSSMKSYLPFKGRKQLKVSFIYDSDPDSSGWIYSHELGRTHLENTSGGFIMTEKHENCDTDESFFAAVNASAENKADVILTTSPVQMNRSVRAAADHPGIRFLNCSVNLPHSLVQTYYGRMYEAKFLMGALAATAAENGIIGYRADYPLYGTIAGINAFAIGASYVDPRVKIHLKWSTKEGTDWMKEFISEGVSIISSRDIIRPKRASREYGVYRLAPDGSVKNLAAPIWDWGRYYELLIGNLLHGSRKALPQTDKSQAVNYWYGMSAGVIDVILSDDLPSSTVKLISILRSGIISGQVNPFSGELRSQTGLIHTASEPPLSGGEIIRMNWLYENIKGSLPERKELNEKAKEAVDVSGVLEK